MASMYELIFRRICMRLKLLVLLVFTLLLSGQAMAEFMTVSFSGAEMRSAPNAMAAKTISDVPPYTPLMVLEKGVEYYKVKDYRGRTGWVHRVLLGSSPGIMIIGDRANVRQGPGTSQPVLFQLSRGEAARLINKQDKWLEIQTYDGRQGWVADFLTWGQ